MHHAGMDTPSLRLASGWTLSELLISLSLMSVLAAVALPAYQQQQRQTRRSDAQLALQQLQFDQSQWRSTHEAYAASLTALGRAHNLSPQGHYQINITQSSAQSYTLEAHAQGGQVHDQNCTPMRLTWQESATVVLSAGSNPSSDPDRCWRQ
jgi:type IV pilus assembly protein PilE